ncbi:hypothetical protein [Dankookia sp. P2]|uniref:hypothetical protein n=1 Tax=Dankookia sp. P2 TaxID=3423955 RepID=UPI003D6752BC
MAPAARCKDPVPWTMAAVWLAYLASLPMIFPDYLGQVIPLVWDYYLDLGGFAWWQVILTERLGTALMLLLPLGLVAARPGWGTLPKVITVAALGATVAAVVQHKGWSYHAMPVRLLAGLLAVVLAARWLDRALPAPRASRAAPALAVVAAFGLGIHGFAGAEAPWREITWSWSRGGEVTALLKREAYGERLLVLSPDIFPVFPALNYAQGAVHPADHESLATAGRLPGLPGRRRALPRDLGDVAHRILRLPDRGRGFQPGAAGRHPDFHPAGHTGLRPALRRARVFRPPPLFAETLRRYRLAAEIEGYRLLRRED